TGRVRSCHPKDRLQRLCSLVQSALAYARLFICFSLGRVSSELRITDWQERRLPSHNFLELFANFGSSPAVRVVDNRYTCIVPGKVRMTSAVHAAIMALLLIGVSQKSLAAANPLELRWNEIAPMVVGH